MTASQSAAPLLLPQFVTNVTNGFDVTTKVKHFTKCGVKGAFKAVVHLTKLQASQSGTYFLIARHLWRFSWVVSTRRATLSLSCDFKHGVPAFWFLKSFVYKVGRLFYTQEHHFLAFPAVSDGGEPLQLLHRPLSGCELQCFYRFKFHLEEERPAAIGQQRVYASRW